MSSKSIPVGTRSLLYGVHQVFIHPLFVALAWWRLYGFPWDPCLWLCFIVHDWGYWGKTDMDGDNGLSHPYLGAVLVYRLLRSVYGRCFRIRYGLKTQDAAFLASIKATWWGEFCQAHSRSWARACSLEVSKLCVADKLAVALQPAWMWIFMAWASGELWEYMARNADMPRNPEMMDWEDEALRGARGIWYFHAGVRSYLRRWAFQQVEKPRFGCSSDWAKYHL